jgi:alkylation response protein AidB-like acyl-CoA dehydrogenase
MLDVAEPASHRSFANTDAPGLLRAIGSAIPLLQRWAMAAPSAFPADSVALLHEAGGLHAPLPRPLGGLGLGTEPDGAAACSLLLAVIGEGSLPLGRVFEAHVNAVRLIWRYGNAADHLRLRDRLQTGALFALWVTDGRDALRGEAVGGTIRLQGGKAFCSAAGHATDAVVTATLGDTQPRLLWLPLNQGERVSAGAVGLTGMAGSATGAVDFSGVTVGAEAAFGAAGDYLREPDFSTGAWRGSAVAWGGLRALVTAVRSQLVERQRQHDPHQQARFGQLLIAAETARHFVLEAARRGEAADEAPEAAIAYVNLARIAVERACLDAMELAQRALGLQAFVAANPVAQICRDLAVYLRQPAPDEVLANAAIHGFTHAAFP